MNNIEIIQNLNELLTSVNIKNVVYVDDKFDIENRKDDFFAKMKVLNLQKKFADKCPIPFSKPEIFNIELNKWWDNPSSTEQIKWEYIKKNIESNNEQNERPIYWVDQLFEYTNFEKYSSKQWESIYQNKSYEKKWNNNDGILFLFDNDLNLSSKRTGREYAMQLLRNEKFKERSYCGIFSHTFHINEEFLQRQDFRDKAPDIYIYPIAKERLQKEDDFATFVDGIKNVLWVKHVEKLKEQSNLIIQNALNQTLTHMNNLMPPTFKKIVLDTSFNEGCWELDSLFRLMYIILDKEVKTAIVSDEVRNLYSEQIHQVRSINKIPVNINYPLINEQLNSLRLNEVFIEGDILNKMHYPISNGDIFNIKGKLYILLCQPCNLSLRNNGERSRKYDIASLIPIILEEKANAEKIEGYSINDKDVFALFSDYKITSLSLLDLTIYNNEGKAIIDFNLDNDKFPNEIQENLHLRYLNLVKYFKKFKNTLDNAETIPDTCSKKKAIIDYIMSPDCIKPFKIKGEDITVHEHYIEFPIIRIGNYKPRYSKDLLDKFAAYLSRTGFERDFTD